MKPLHPLVKLIFLQTLFSFGKTSINYNWIGEVKLLIYRGETGLSGNYYFGLHEFNSMAFALHLLRKDEIFIDIGANLGSYSLLASGLTKCNSLAFEPVPHTFVRLRENIKINNLESRIDSRMMALTSLSIIDSTEPLLFSNDRGAENFFVDKGYRGKSIRPRVSTVDFECSNFRPVLIKIDVEGHEYNVIKGAANTLSKDSLLGIIIENKSVEVSSLIEGYGFKQFFYDGINRELLENKESDINLIWIRTDKIEQIRHKVKNAPYVKIGKKNV